MHGEQCHGEAVDSKGNAAGMRLLALIIMNTPDIAEVLAMVVEAHARGWRRCGVIRNQQFEFQRLLALAHRHDLANPAKEWVIRDVDRKGEAQLIREERRTGDPALAKLQDFLWRADTHKLPHPE